MMTARMGTVAPRRSQLWRTEADTGGSRDRPGGCEQLCLL
jgi:hypothetical protein